MVPSAIKITKNGVQYINKVDRTKYMLKELVHAANKDVGKYATREAKKKMRSRTYRGKKNTQYWARKDGSLLVGYKPGGFYMGFEELGTSNHIKKEFLKNAVLQNKNEGTYIKSIEDENKVLGIIDESEEIGNE